MRIYKDYFLAGSFKIGSSVLKASSAFDIEVDEIKITQSVSVSIKKGTGVDNIHKFVVNFSLPFHKWGNVEIEQPYNPLTGNETKSKILATIKAFLQYATYYKTARAFNYFDSLDDIERYYRQNDWLREKPSYALMNRIRHIRDNAFYIKNIFGITSEEKERELIEAINRRFELSERDLVWGYKEASGHGGRLSDAMRCGSSHDENITTTRSSHV